MREDIGRLAEGCKADIVAVDLECPEMLPARDPLRSLIFHAADRAVSEVWVNGRQLVAAGEVTTLDTVGAGQTLAEAQAAMMRTAPGRDYKQRSADEITPLSLPMGS